MSNATKAKTTPVTTAKKKPRRVPLPPSVIGLLNARQVCDALGGVSERKFATMLARGEFPRATKRVGKSRRWPVELVNEWCKSLPDQAGTRTEAEED